MKIEDYKLGQKVSLYGIIEEINIEDIYDKENTTTLSIKTVTGKIHVNPKWEEVKLNQPKLKIPQFILDWVDDSREHGYEFDEWFYYSNQPLEVYKWLNKKNKRQKELNALALVTLIVNGPDAVTVEKEKLYRVKLNDHLYFKEFIDSTFPVFVIDDMPGALDDAFIGKEELALKHAREFGGRLEEVEEVTE